MSPEEALRLCRLTKALFPAMTMDEFTPQAWAVALRRDRYQDAEQALEELAREERFVGVSEIVARIRRIRRNRVLDFGPLPDPPSDLDPDDHRAYTRWLEKTTGTIADGTYQAPTPDAVGQRRDVIRELGSVGQSVDAAMAARDVREAHAEAREALRARDAERLRERNERRRRLEELRAADRSARHEPEPQP